MPKNKDGFEIGARVSFEELAAALNKPRTEEVETKPKKGKRKAD